jgi:cytochrome c oxidase subunit 4
LGDSHDKHEPHSAARYWMAFGALLIGTILTYGLHRIDLGHLAFPIAMIIAFTKAMFVVLFFMHLIDHPGVNRLVFGVTILLLFFGILMVFADTFTRFPLSAPHYQ